MDFETLEKLWRSEANDRATVAETYILEATLKTLTQRRGAFSTGMGLIGLALIVWTGAIAYAVMWGKIADITQEWGILALLVISWLAFLIAQAQQKRHVRAYPEATTSMPDALRALIDENRTARARTRMMGVALLVFAGVLALSVGQLHAVGKMEWRHVVQGSLLFGGALLLSAAIHAVRYIRMLKPEGERLRRLLEQYAQD
ncbi:MULTISPECIES: hypothetical protein [Asticcacaulis]|uniref:hypothetical protein n=1 Tax=Asticcacaulis TaxID=76890 RepID=UPI001AE3C47B|nr:MULTISPECIES: hypothetical protein [Asticcacaulis]MBP2161767.1 hypothetical protein [Asticcacaulis solisilvae]MDR6802813.1 hypothetical protein [Asticcacaulis sp. BE141]